MTTPKFPKDWEALDCYVTDVHDVEIGDELFEYHPEATPCGPNETNSFFLSAVLTENKKFIQIEVNKEPDLQRRGRKWGDKNKQVFIKAKFEPSKSDITELVAKPISINIKEYKQATLKIKYVKKNTYTTFVKWEKLDPITNKAIDAGTRTTSYTWIR